MWFLSLTLLCCSFFSQIKAEDDQPLPGVLLSLSGGVFRSNLLTQDNGILTFSNLVRLWSMAPESDTVVVCGRTM